MVFNDDVIPVDDVCANDARKPGGYLEAVFHILLCYLLSLLQVVAVLDLLLHTVSVAQQTDDFLTMRGARHASHDKVPEVASKTLEDRVFREIDELVLPLVICDLDVQQAAFKMSVKTLVLFHTVFQGGLHVFLRDGLIHELVIFVFFCDVVFLFLKLLVEREDAALFV